MAAERELMLRMKADASGLVGEVRTANESVKTIGDQHRVAAGEVTKFTSAMNDESEVMRSWTSLTVLATTAVTGYAVAMVYGTKQVVDHRDEVGKLSQIYGIAVEQLSTYSYMAKLANVSNEQLAQGLRNLTRNMSEAAAGRGNGAAIFEALGLSVNGKGLDQILTEVADKFASFKDGPEKAAIAMELFGRSGERLIPLLNQGSSGIAALRDEARKLGITFDQEAARQAEQFNDNLTRLNATFMAGKQAMVNEYLPALTNMIQKFVEARKEGDGFFSSLFQGLTAGGGDLHDAQRGLAETTDQLLALQNQLDRVKQAGGAPGVVAALEVQVAELQARARSYMAAVQVNQPGFFGPPAPTTTTAPTVGTGSPVYQGMTEAQMRRAEMKAAQDEVRQQQELQQYQNRLTQQYVSARAGMVAQTEHLQVGAIADPQARARAQLELEKHYRDQSIEQMGLGELEKRDLLDRNAQWYVARQAQLNEQLKPEYQKNLDAWSDSNRLMRDNWNRTMLSMQQAGEDMFVQWATTGKFQIKDLFRLLEQEAAKSVYRQTIGGLFGHSSGDSGVERAVSDLTAMFGLGTSAEAAGNAGYFLHSGGVVGSAGSLRSVPRGTFFGAPRLHSGLAPDEFPAILQAGETVLPRGVSTNTVHAPFNLTIDARGADAGVEARIVSAVREQLPGMLHQHRRALMGIVNIQRRESGRDSL